MQTNANLEDNFKSSTSLVSRRVLLGPKWVPQQKYQKSTCRLKLAAWLCQRFLTQCVRYSRFGSSGGLPLRCFFSLLFVNTICKIQQVWLGWVSFKLPLRWPQKCSYSLLSASDNYVGDFLSPYSLRVYSCSFLHFPHFLYRVAKCWFFCTEQNLQTKFYPKNTTEGSDHFGGQLLPTLSQLGCL